MMATNEQMEEAWKKMIKIPGFIEVMKRLAKR